MHIERLYAEGFRNLAPLDWRPHPRVQLLAGDNGQGKTNILEALYVVAGLRSFRAGKLADCIQFDAERATVAVTYRRRGDRGDLGLQFGAAGRKLTVDGKTVSNAEDFVGKLVVVLFGPSDLRLPHAEPAERRRWLDRVVFNHDLNHLHDLRQYERVLGSRNALLKAARHQPVDPQMLEVYEVLLARHGASIVRRRQRVLAAFAPRVREVFAAIAAPGLRADVRYQVRGSEADDVEGALLAALRERRDRDRQLGYTTRGPHRDEVDLLLDERPAQLHASQGQARALVLACKIAEIRSLEAVLGEPPVLLLDDVSSELDAERNRALMQHLGELGGQVLVTTTDPAYIRVRGERRVARVAGGALVADELAGHD